MTSTIARSPPIPPVMVCFRPIRGFTLIEMVMTIVLLGIVAIVGATMLVDSITVSNVTTGNLGSLSQSRYATERLAREIREMQFAGGAYSIASKSATNLVFTKSDGITVTITNSGTNLTLGYSSPSASALLTDQVDTTAATPFELLYFGIDGTTQTTSNADIRFVQITINVRNSNTGIATTQVTRVSLRNA